MTVGELIKKKKEYEKLYNECWFRRSQVDSDKNYNLYMGLQMQEMNCEIQIKEINEQLKELGRVRK